MPKFEVSESMLVDASPDAVQAIVRDFEQWESWSPWLSAEPDCRIDYAEDGKSYAWQGKIIGSGSMQLESEEPGALAYELTFLKPWKSTSKVDFQFEEAEGGCKVSWRMQGSLPFFMFFMKKMMAAWIASDYRRGLLKLKDYAETGSVPSKLDFVGVGTGVQCNYIGLRNYAKIEKLGEAIEPMLDKLEAYVSERKLERVGPTFIQYDKFHVSDASADFLVAIPVKRYPKRMPNAFFRGQLVAPKSYKVKHTGAYRHLGSAWSAAMMRQRHKAFLPNKRVAPFELYISDPRETDEAELVTEIHLPAHH